MLDSKSMQQWDTCKRKLVDLGLEGDEAERVLKESFAWNGAQYWAEEKVLLHLSCHMRVLLSHACSSHFASRCLSWKRAVEPEV